MSNSQTFSPKYNIIYADPPWTYKDKAKSGNRGASCKYPTITTRELYSLPIHKIAAEDCVLFLWATFPLLHDAIDILTGWGFDYKTVAFIWIKKNPKSGTNFFGMGNWTRANAEIVLLGTKGKIKRQDASISQIIEYPILKPHSRKPAIIRYKILQLMGSHLTRIELFATEHIDGWDYTGFEANGQDIWDFLG